MKLLFIALLAAGLIQARGYRAGAASVRITPQTPVWLTGFAARTHPADRVGLDLYTKALAIEDANGYRIIVITADLLGVTREITDDVSRRLQRKYGLNREQVLFNASHTHSGPAVWPRLNLAPMASSQNDAEVEKYGKYLADQFEAVAGKALSTMVDAQLGVAWAEASFAVNRRIEQMAALRPGEKFPSPVDTRVPVLRVNGTDGHTIAILFGYACHNTVLTSDTYEVSSDYAGYAQRAIEQKFTGATALFITLCAGDQRPAPRGTRELAVQHGEALAEAVVGAANHTKPVDEPLRASYLETTLAFQAHTREGYLAESHSADFFMARRGRAMLERWDRHAPLWETKYPVQAIAFGRKLVLLALGGEAVVDYAIRFRQEFPSFDLIVAAYSNDVMGYIPSARVLREGGYEAGDAMLYYVQPGWFTSDVEDKVAQAAHRVVSAVSGSRAVRY